MQAILFRKCILLKQTFHDNRNKLMLLVSEKPIKMCVDVSRDGRFIGESILNEFMKLSTENKKEFLCMHDGYTNTFIQDEIQDEDSKVLCIFIANGSRSGVFPKLSRFNHACAPNAEYIWNIETSSRDLRAMKSIKTGDEITISYIGGKCQDREERRAELMMRWNFKCMCEVCDVSIGEAEEHNKVCDRYKALEIQSQEFLDTFGILVLKRPILNEMYKHAKSMKTLKKSTLLHDILDVAFVSSCHAVHNSKSWGIFPTSYQEYKQDLHAFTKVGKILSKRLYGDAHSIAKEWAKRNEDPLKVFKETHNPLSFTVTLQLNRRK